MKREEITSTLKKCFCKDNKIPIQLFDERFFKERLDLLDATELYDEYCKVLEDFNNEEEYFAYYNNLKDNIINYIKDSKGFKEMQNDEKIFTNRHNYPHSNIYKETNIGKSFISIDIKKANFSTMVYYGLTNGIKFFHSYNWNEFMKMFTDKEYFYKSKYIRQVVFGNCNPKRQITYQSMLMLNLVKSLLKEGLNKGDLFEFDIVSLCSDEIILMLLILNIF